MILSSSLKTSFGETGAILTSSVEAYLIYCKKYITTDLATETAVKNQFTDARDNIIKVLTSWSMPSEEIFAITEGNVNLLTEKSETLADALGNLTSAISSLKSEVSARISESGGLQDEADAAAASYSTAEQAENAAYADYATKEGLLSAAQSEYNDQLAVVNYWQGQLNYYQGIIDTNNAKIASIEALLDTIRTPNVWYTHKNNYVKVDDVKIYAACGDKKIALAGDTFYYYDFDDSDDAWGVNATGWHHCHLNGSNGMLLLTLSQVQNEYAYIYNNGSRLSACQNWNPVYKIIEKANCQSNISLVTPKRDVAQATFTSANTLLAQKTFCLNYSTRK